MQETDSPLPVAVVGVGRMGQHHARTFSKLGLTRLLGVVDDDEERAETVADEYGCQAFTSVQALLDACPQLRAATVAVPTKYHADSAYPLLERGVACLIEKPIAGSVDEAKALAEFAQRHHAVLQVGHTERFNPAVRAVSAMPITPRFIEVTRVSPMTFRSLDVGVVMDMMIHDLDVVLSLVGRPIVDVQAVGISVMSEHEDICDARLTFEGGCVATLKGSRVALKTDRRLRLFSEDAYVSLDYGSREGIVVRKTANAETLDDVRDKLRGGADLSDLNYMDLVNVEQLTMDLPADEADQLTAQAKAFVNAVRSDAAPVVTAEQGYAAVDAAERIVRAIQGHAWEGLAQQPFDAPA
ncbi:MAG: Gfo/Idh/MocA family oxidoreductase [Phycisphaeraceae bacterium]